MKLKVCGMKYKDNIEAVANLQPDYLGFIFYEKSPRFFYAEIPKIPKSVKKVGVFVNANLSEIENKIKKYHLDAVQLHGNESPEFCKRIKDAKIIKVFSIKDNFNFSKLKPYEDVCDYFLFDTKGKLPGGNGYIFNWEIFKDYPSTKPFFLSGGIGIKEIDNVKSFLQGEESKYCYAIDVNSKFELQPGLKNSEELKEFKYELQH